MSGQQGPGFVQLRGNAGGGGGGGGGGRGNPPPPPGPQIRGGPSHGGPAGGGQLPSQQGQGIGMGHQQPPSRPPLPNAMKPSKKPSRKAVGFSDLSQTRPKGPEICYEELTTYEVLTLRKADPSPDEKHPSWVRTVHVRESLPQRDIIRQINALNRKDRNSQQTVAHKISKLYPHQAEQVGYLLDTEKSQETDDQFEWTVCQIDKALRSSRVGCGSKKETKTITLFLQRAPRKELDPVAVWQNVNAAKNRELKYRREKEEDEEKERNFQRMFEMQKAEMLRKQKQEDAERMRNPAMTPGILPVNDQQQPDGKTKKGSGPKPKERKKHDDCSSDSELDSDSDSCSYSWSTGTGSRSSSSRYRRAPSHNRHRSHHRYEQRHYIDDSPQVTYTQPYARQAQRILPYNPFAENYVPVVSTPIAPRVVVHQRPVENPYLAHDLRRADEFRRDAEEYVRARQRAIAEAKYRDRRRRFDGFL